MLDSLNRTLQTIHSRVLTKRKSRSTQKEKEKRTQGPDLIRRVRAEHIQRRRDELGLDRDRVVSLLLARCERLLDRVDAGGGVACELDVGAELDGLRREPARDR